ncbi:hypothetical protein P3S68_003785 [Capsicum galapagoense]
MIYLVEMEEIEMQQGSHDQSIDVFSAIMCPKHPGCVRLYGTGVIRTSLKRINGTSDLTFNATNDVIHQMEERMQKMEDQIEEQKRTIRQKVIADVIAQLQIAGLIYPKMLAALSISLSRESTSTLAYTGRNSQNNQGDHDIEDGGKKH